MNIQKCKVCGSFNLRSLMKSQTGHKWITCDNCGNISTPIITNDSEKIMNQWNKENTKQLDEIKKAYSR